MKLSHMYMMMALPVFVTQMAQAQVLPPNPENNASCPVALKYDGVYLVKGSEAEPNYTIDVTSHDNVPVVRPVEDIINAIFVCGLQDGSEKFVSYSRHELSDKINDPAMRDIWEEESALKKAYDDVANEECSDDERIWVEQTRPDYPASTATCDFNFGS